MPGPILFRLIRILRYNYGTMSDGLCTFEYFQWDNRTAIAKV